MGWHHSACTYAAPSQAPVLLIIEAGAWTLRGAMGNIAFDFMHDELDIMMGQWKYTSTI